MILRIQSLVYNGTYEQVEDVMTERKPKSPKDFEQKIGPKKPTHNKAELVTISLPSNFPFQNLRCSKEHKEIFKGLFGEANL